MKKIVSNVLIVSTQLIVGGLFLFILFSDKTENNRVVVIENNNLDKMADAVSELFVVDHAVNVSNALEDTKKEEELKSEQQRIEEEQQKAAEAEAARIAQEEAERKAQEEAEAAARKAQEEAALKNATYVDASGYLSKPASGFNVTTGNRTYSLNNGEFSIVAGVVACEAATKDDALGVMSVILNRADRRGMTPVQVVAEGNGQQFWCYLHPKDPSIYASVVTDALNGIRNNNYTSFNSARSGVSDNYISSNGNRYY